MIKLERQVINNWGKNKVFMSRLTDIEKQLITHNRRLQKLKEQQAFQGISVDPKIPMEIEDIEKKIAGLRVERQNLVKKQNSTSESSSTHFEELPKEDETPDQKTESPLASKSKKSLLDKFRDQVWGGIGAIVTIIGVIVATLTLYVTVYPFDDPTTTPTSTLTAISTEAVTPTPTPTPVLASTPTSSPVSPSITPNSSLVTYTGNLAIPLISGLGPKVYLTSFDGQGLNGPNPVALDAQQPIFSSDGRSILVKAVIEGQSGIHKLTASGFNPELSIPRKGVAWPVLSPDGQTVMFSETTLDFRLHIKKPDEIVEEVFIDGFPIFAQNLLWSEDNQLVFQACATWLKELDNCGIWVTNANDIDPQRVIDGKDGYPMALRKGILAYMSQIDGDWEIYLLPLGGGPAINLTNNNFADGLPAISPDGNGIAYISNESGDWGLWTMDLNGQNKKWMFNIDPGRGTIDLDQWATERMSWRR